VTVDPVKLAAQLGLADVVAPLQGASGALGCPLA
jgi:hypothetical protein